MNPQTVEENIGNIVGQNYWMNPWGNRQWQVKEYKKDGNGKIVTNSEGKPEYIMKTADDVTKTTIKEAVSFALGRVGEKITDKELETTGFNKITDEMNAAAMNAGKSARWAVSMVERKAPRLIDQ